MIRTIIDISHWEDPIDFKKVAAAGIVAVIAKATQGAAGIEIAYAKFKKLATKYEFLWGSYHFGTGSKVNVQVDHYLKIAKPTDRELVCLDFEPNPNGPTMTPTQAREFISLFQHLTGRYPVLYSGHLLKENLGAKPDDLLSKCRLWLAQYGPKPVLPVGWKKYTLWQYTNGHAEFAASAPAIATNLTAPPLDCVSCGRSRNEIHTPTPRFDPLSSDL